MRITWWVEEEDICRRRALAKDTTEHRTRTASGGLRRGIMVPSLRCLPRHTFRAGFGGGKGVVTCNGMSF